MREIFRSTKLIDGFSTCFRQWKSAPIHCSKLHGYSISFKVTFEGELDFRNWVVDFGFMKRSKTMMSITSGWGPVSYGSAKDWFDFMFDHSVLIASDDPLLEEFKALHYHGALRLRVIDQVGCEMFAKLVYEKLQAFLAEETEGRVTVVQVECFEHSKNSAIYMEKEETVYYPDENEY